MQTVSLFLPRTKTRVNEPVSLLLLFANLEEELLGPDKDDARESGTYNYPDSPLDWRMLLRLEMGTCFRKEEGELFSNINSSTR